MSSNSISELEEKVAILEAENEALKRKVNFFESHKQIAKGVKGETLIADITGGILTAANAPEDLLVGNIKIEIKYSRLSSPYSGTKTLRWTWSKIFGNSGSKKYNRLILIGDKDTRFEYKDASTPYVLFDIPYEEAFSLSTSRGNNNQRQIQVTTDWKKVKNKGKALFEVYEIKLSDLTSRYKL